MHVCFWRIFLGRLQALVLVLSIAASEELLNACAAGTGRPSSVRRPGIEGSRALPGLLGGDPAVLGASTNSRFTSLSMRPRDLIG